MLKMLKQRVEYLRNYMRKQNILIIGMKRQFITNLPIEVFGAKNVD